LSNIFGDPCDPNIWKKFETYFCPYVKVKDGMITCMYSGKCPSQFDDEREHKNISCKNANGWCRF